MPRRVPSPLSPVLRQLRSPRPELLAQRQVAASLISVAGLVGRVVTSPDGAEVGRIRDAVARWEGDRYPPLTGLVVKVGRRRCFVSIGQVRTLTQTGAQLSSARVDLIDFIRRPGEVVLAGDVIDHQLVDIDGVQVIRGSDLYVAEVGGSYRLVGVDIGLPTLLRRLGPRRLRTRATPSRVIDWSAIHPFGGPGHKVRLAGAHSELHRLRPGEIADLLEELGRNQRHELLDALDSDAAADVLEELQDDDVVAALREIKPERAAALLAEMQPDEAIDALRDLDEDERRELLDLMDPLAAQRLRGLLVFAEDTAGGLMTPVVVAVHGDESVAAVRDGLRAHADHSADVDAVLVIDDEGRVLDDITLFELLLSEPDQLMLELIGEPWPITVTADAGLTEVLGALTDNRRSSIVVVDDGRPIGRILADDLLDALVAQSRSPFSRLPS